MSLPIIDKIFDNQLVLSDYTVSKGQIDSLAQSVQLASLQHVQLSNNHISPQMFTQLIRGLKHLPRLKTLVYRQNGFG